MVGSSSTQSIVAMRGGCGTAATGSRTPMTRCAAVGNLMRGRSRSILGCMRTDDDEARAAAHRIAEPAAEDSRAPTREELRRRVAEGYYLTPRVTWEVAKRIVELGGP